MKRIERQHTVACECSVSGVGLHTGDCVNVTMRPAPPNTGIVFQRLDVMGKSQKVEAHFRNVSETKLGTTIANREGVSVSTVEHLLCALWACSIDNALILLDGSEVPIMDGSAGPFMNIIQNAGISLQDARRRFLRVKRCVEVFCTDEKISKKIAISSNGDLAIDFDIDFDHQSIGHQRYEFRTRDSLLFSQEIGHARTFGFKRDLDAMRKVGLAKGASLENAIGLDDEKVLNENGLRFKNEFVRHKILDCIGDLFLAGMRILGHVKAENTGHAMNNSMLNALFASPLNYEIV
jgi:UDP-3-O-[3-hydroxymyristoyl] N-acetylglucosamine deacetylase